MKYFYSLILKLKEFGFKVSFYSFVSKLLDYVMPNSVLAYKVANKKHSTILILLYRKYKYIIERINKNGFSMPVKSKKIWVFWWQGLETAPFIVKKCISRIQEMYSDYEIIIIDQNNISDYIQLEPEIMDKVRNNVITYTHLSDIIRMRLMKQYGGTWMDATIFLTDTINLEESFVTLHLNEQDNLKMVSKGKWCGFFMGGKDNIVAHYADEFFSEYWKNENQMIDYFLIDYILQLGYEYIPKIKECIDSVPINNPQVFMLQKNMGCLFDEKIYSEICRDTCVHKLSYKETFCSDVGGKPTFYGKLIIKDVHDEENRNNYIS